MSRQVPGGTLVPNLDFRGACGGRLTLTSGTAVTISDVSGAGTVYFTAFGNVAGLVSLYDGSEWKLTRFTEVSLALTLTSGKNYDVYGYLSGGNLALELSAAWTNDTTRADALGTQDGIQVKSGAATRRYLGTLRASGSNVTEDSAAKRFLWNMYNRVARRMSVVDSTASWTFSTAGTYRQANGSSANQVAIVRGLDVDPVIAVAQNITYHSSGGCTTSGGVGISSTTVNSATLTGMYPTSVTIVNCMSRYNGYPGVGYYYLAWLEGVGSDVLATVTWYGNTNGFFKTGLTAETMA